jgi:hypothetical protein
MVSVIITHVLPLILIELMHLFDSIAALSAIVHLVVVLLLLLDIKVFFFMMIRLGRSLFKVQSFLSYRLLLPRLGVVRRRLWPHISRCWLSIGSVGMGKSCIRGG